MPRASSDAPRLRRPTRRATSWVLFGSLASGLGAYAFQVVGTRGLGDEAYAPISVLWTIQYLALSVPLIAVEAYLTRAVARGAGADGSGLRRPLRVLAGWLLLTAVLLGVGTYLAREALFDGAGDLAAVVAALVLAYGGLVVVRGQMAGTDRFRSYGAATALESLARVALAVPVVLLAASTRSLAWIMPVGPLLVVAWWWWDQRDGGVRHVAEDAAAARPDPAADVDESSGAVRFLAITTAANGAAQTLLAGGPIVLIPLGASAAEVSVFFVTVTAARAPLAFALGGVLSRLLPPLTRLARAGDDAALRRVALALAGATAVVAALAAGAAWWVGPEVVGLLFGSAFTPGRLFTTLTAAGVMLCTGALLVNQVLIARGSEARLLAPWGAALATAAVVVITAADATPTLRVTYGMAAGMAVALVGLVAAVLTAPALRAGGAAPPTVLAPASAQPSGRA